MLASMLNALVQAMSEALHLPHSSITLNLKPAFNDI